MKYLFGPVNSRRLGQSQGIDMLAGKICNFNCIYCEAGVTTLLTWERREYVPTAEIIGEIRELIAEPATLAAIDVFTVTAGGEPTLHSGIGEVIRYLKENTNKPVAVLTNGSLLHRADVRHDLLAADIVIPSLDAARPQSFRKINRPAPGVEIETIINGLCLFKQEFSGRLWLEILLAKGINDSPEEIEALRLAVQKIGPDLVQLNTVARPPLESFARPLTETELKEISVHLGGPVEIITPRIPGKWPQTAQARPEEKIIDMLHRRPCPAAEIRDALGLSDAEVSVFLGELCRSGRIQKTSHEGTEYYRVG